MAVGPYPFLDFWILGVVRNTPSYHELFELFVRIVFSTSLAKVFFIIEVEIDDNLRSVGKAKKRSIPLETLFIPTILFEVAP